MNPKITIITVVFNGVNELEKTIESIIQQSYKNIEYIIIDGGSLDGTIGIIEHYQSYITYWLTEPDDGIYYAMNKAILHAQGDWCIFMNSGDLFYDKDVLTRIFSHNLSSDIIYGNTILYVNNKYRLNKPRKLSLIKYRMPFCHQSVFCRLEILKNNNFDTKYRIVADFDLFRKLYYKGFNFEYINSIISIFNANDGASTRSGANAERKLVVGCYKYNIILIFEWLKKTLIPQKILYHLRAKRGLLFHDSVDLIKNT